MFKYILELLPFLVSSGATFYLLYRDVPINVLQQINSVLLIALLGLFSAIGKINAFPKLKTAYRIVMATLLSLFSQLLIFATGGFFSPFLIVLHLLTIAFSFILNFGSSISFLLLSVGLLVSSIILNQNSASLFKQDPFSVVLYGISFVVIIPLIQFISKTYHLNEVLYKKLTGYLRISSGREHSLLKGLRDIVLITDAKLNVVSVNETAATILKVSESDYQTRKLFEVLKLVDQNRQPISERELSINNIIEDKTTRIIDNFFCLIPGQPDPLRVRIQISPVLDESRSVVQIVFLLSEAPNIDLNKIFQMSLPVSKKLEPLYQEIKQLSYEQKPDLLNHKIELLQKINEDLLIIQEIYSQPAALAYEDVAWVIKSSIESLRLLANSMQVVTHFNIWSEEDAETAYENLRRTTPAVANEMISPYSLFINSRSVAILTKKLLEIGLFVASSKPSGQIFVYVKTIRAPQHIVELTIQADSPALSPDECNSLLIQNYPNIKAINNLHFASGLEGAIAKIIAQQLGSNIEVNYNAYNSRLEFRISIHEKTIAPVHLGF